MHFIFREKIKLNQANNNRRNSNTPSHPSPSYWPREFPEEFSLTLKEQTVQCYWVLQNTAEQDGLFSWSGEILVTGPHKGRSPTILFLSLSVPLWPRHVASTLEVTRCLQTKVTAPAPCWAEEELRGYLPTQSPSSIPQNPVHWRSLKCFGPHKGPRPPPATRKAGKWAALPSSIESRLRSSAGPS